MELCFQTYVIPDPTNCTVVLQVLILLNLPLAISRGGHRYFQSCKMVPIFDFKITLLLNTLYSFQKVPNFFSVTRCFFDINDILNVNIIIRGGVEDTSLEAKETKKNPRPRPRTAFPRTDTLEAKDRNARGLGQGPRTQAQVLSKKKKKVFTKIFQAISTKKCFPKNFSSAPQNFNNSKNSALLEPRTGQFSRTCGLETKAKDIKMCPRGRPRGQGRP